MISYEAQTRSKNIENISVFFIEMAIQEGTCVSEKKPIIEKEKIECLGFELGIE